MALKSMTICIIRLKNAENNSHALCSIIITVEKANIIDEYNNELNLYRARYGVARIYVIS